MSEDAFEAWAKGVTYNQIPLTERGGIPYFLAAHAFEAGIKAAIEVVESTEVTMSRQFILAKLDELLEKHE